MSSLRKKSCPTAEPDFNKATHSPLDDILIIKPKESYGVRPWEEGWHSLDAFLQSPQSTWSQQRSRKASFLLWWPYIIVLQGRSQSVQFSRSVMPDSLWPHGLSLPVRNQLPELAQTHVQPVSDAIQPSHPLSSPSPPAFNLSQHQGLFQWVSSSRQGAKVLEFQLQSFQWIFRTDFL